MFFQVCLFLVVGATLLNVLGEQKEGALTGVHFVIQTCLIDASTERLLPDACCSDALRDA